MINGLDRLKDKLEDCHVNIDMEENGHDVINVTLNDGSQFEIVGKDLEVLKIPVI